MILKRTDNFGDKRTSVISTQTVYLPTLSDDVSFSKIIIPQGYSSCFSLFSSTCVKPVVFKKPTFYASCQVVTKFHKSSSFVSNGLISSVFHL